MKAQLIVSEKLVYDDGSLTEIVIWRVPTPVPPSTHFLKYRLAYVVKEVRVIGFDNERGKGDHGHAWGREFEYTWQGLAQLLADFRTLVEFCRRPTPSRPSNTEYGENVIDLMKALRENLLGKEERE